MPHAAEVISHWHQSVEGFNTSTLGFYHSVEEALKEKEAPNLRIEQVEWRESGMLSAKRVYLRVSYGRLSFDLCAAPFGKDFFFSWWLIKRPPDAAVLIGCAGVFGALLLLAFSVAKFGFFQGGILALLILVGVWWALRTTLAAEAFSVDDAMLAIPGLGPLYQRFVKPVTYYSTDTRLVFEESVHRVVLEVISGLLTIAKLPPLDADSFVPKSRSALI